MSITDLFIEALGASPPANHHYECGHCGATVRSRSVDCPYCEDSRIVTFELES